MKVVVVTGAAGGIGRATAQRFNERGWTVIGVDLERPATVDEFAMFVVADVSSDTAMAELFRSVGATHGRLDALVNNAAVCPGASLAETSAEDWDAVMAVNVKGAFLGIKHGHALLAAARGAVVNVCSVHALATSTNIAAYAASKGALLAMTRALAVELAPTGIRVNAVLPGAVDTAMLRAGLGRGGDAHGRTVVEQLDALAARTVLGRIGAADEIASAIHFLADATHSSFMTGQSLVVDGGAMARLSTE
ncbi:MAG: SDR family oxidoreductase [Deltaproteobacteria bacterium]|nr:SDR family oxidoreductase [Deltaproteobacteria bacterium]